MCYNQGDIVLVPFPYTSGKSSKVRPAIVVSNAIVNRTKDVILAQITSNPNYDYYSYELDPKNLSNSLIRPSQVRCHKLFTCQKSIVIKTISALDPMGLNELYEKICTLLS